MFLASPCTKHYRILARYKMFSFCLCNLTSVTVTYPFILNFNFPAEMLTNTAMQFFYFIVK